MIKLYRFNSKIYVTKKGIAIAYFDLKRFKYVKAPTHFKEGYNIVITDGASSAAVRPDVKSIKSWTSGTNRLILDGFAPISYGKVESVFVPQYYAQNMFIDSYGHICPRRNPTKGLYRYDGQFFIPPRRRND